MIKGILLISGNATAGKDTFFNGLSLLKKNRVKRFAFADQLKSLTQSISTSILKKEIEFLSPQEKEMFRPVMVSVGELARKVDGDFWVKKVDSQIQWLDEIQEEFYAVITDCRYESEYLFFKEKYNCPIRLLYIERYDCLGNVIPPANDTERESLHVLEKMSDYHLSWVTFADTKNKNDFLKEIIGSFINEQMSDFFTPERDNSLSPKT